MERVIVVVPCLYAEIIDINGEKKECVNRLSFLSIPLASQFYVFSIVRWQRRLA